MREAGKVEMADDPLQALRARIERQALAYHKAVDGTGEGEYGCPGLECPGVRRLVAFGLKCADELDAALRSHVLPNDSGARLPDSGRGSSSTHQADAVPSVPNGGDSGHLQALVARWRAAGGARDHSAVLTLLRCANELVAALRSLPVVPPLVRYMNAETTPERDAAFLDTYAERIRNGTAASWEIPNTVATTLEDIAKRIRSLPVETDQEKHEGDTRMDTPKVISDDFRTAPAALPNVTVDNSGFRMNWDASSLVSKSTAPILTLSTSENAGECPVHGPIPMTQVVTISMGGVTDGLYCQRCFADLVAGHCHKFTR